MKREKNEKKQKQLRISRETLGTLNPDEVKTARGAGGSCSVCGCTGMSIDHSKACPV